MASDWLLLCASHLAIMAPALVEHVVADAGAFLKKVPLQVRFRTVMFTVRNPPRRSEVSVRSLLSAVALPETTASAPRAITRPPACLHLLPPSKCIFPIYFLPALSLNYLTFSYIPSPFFRIFLCGCQAVIYILCFSKSTKTCAKNTLVKVLSPV